MKMSRSLMGVACSRESLAIRQKKDPEHWSTFDAQLILGIALLGQKKYAEAEPLSLQGYRGMKDCEAHAPAYARVRLTAAIQRLILLYDDWGKPERAAGWRKKLEDEKHRHEK